MLSLEGDYTLLDDLFVDFLHVNLLVEFGWELGRLQEPLIGSRSHDEPVPDAPGASLQLPRWCSRLEVAAKQTRADDEIRGEGGRTRAGAFI